MLLYLSKLMPNVSPKLFNAKHTKLSSEIQYITLKYVYLNFATKKLDAKNTAYNLAKKLISAGKEVSVNNNF